MPKDSFASLPNPSANHPSQHSSDQNRDWAAPLPQKWKGDPRTESPWVSNWPMPGMENSVSVTTEPEINRLTMMPTTVVIGINAFDSACFITTSRRGRPLARAVRM